MEKGEINDTFYICKNMKKHAEWTSRLTETASL